MTAQRTAWHFLFAIHLRKRGSPSFDVRDEVPLSEEPPRMDYLILRKSDAGAAIAPGATLAGLWPRLSLVTVVELKTIGRPYRTATWTGSGRTSTSTAPTSTAKCRYGATCGQC